MNIEKKGVGEQEQEIIDSKEALGGGTESFLNAHAMEIGAATIVSIVFIIVSINLYNSLAEVYSKPMAMLPSLSILIMLLSGITLAEKTPDNMQEEGSNNLSLERLKALFGPLLVIIINAIVFHEANPFFLSLALMSVLRASYFCAEVCHNRDGEDIGERTY